MTTLYCFLLYLQLLQFLQCIIRSFETNKCKRHAALTASYKRYLDVGFLGDYVKNLFTKSKNNCATYFFKINFGFLQRAPWGCRPSQQRRTKNNPAVLYHLPDARNKSAPGYQDFASARNDGTILGLNSVFCGTCQAQCLTWQEKTWTEHDCTERRH